MPFAARFLAVLSAASALTALALAVLGSFAFLLFVSLAGLFGGTALLARRIEDEVARAGAVLMIVGAMTLLFGLVATLIFVLGWIVFGAGVALLLTCLLRAQPQS